MNNDYKIVCVMCGSTNVSDDSAEGVCLDCGHAWINDNELFEKRINYEKGGYQQAS